MKRLVIFLVITFSLTWIVELVAGIASGACSAGINNTPAMVPIAVVSMFFPLVGALTANALCRPAERIDLCWKPRIKQNMRYYLLAWLAPSAVAALGAMLFFVLNPQWFDPTMMSFVRMVAENAGVSADEVAARITPTFIAPAIAFAIVVAPFINMIPAFGEEVGWRGMLFPTLAEKATPRTAILLSGVIWGIWHAPLIAMGHHYGTGYPGFPWTGVLTIVVACTALGCILSYLRLQTQSVWPCALAHGAVNAVTNFGIMFSVVGNTLFGPNALSLVAGIPMLVLAAICWIPVKEQLQAMHQPA